MVRLVSSESKNNGYFKQFEKEYSKIAPRYSDCGICLPFQYFPILKVRIVWHLLYFVN